MKAKIATALSLIGVLGAGSAAALVNTQILDGGAAESGASKAVLPPTSTIALSVPAASNLAPMEIDLDVPDATSTTTTDPTTTIAATPTSEFLTSFDVGEAGVVTVDVVDERLVLVSAEPKAGWTVTKAEDDSNDDSDDDENEVEVEFRSATIEVEFEAALIDGRIVPRVESSYIGADQAPAANSGPTTTARATSPTTTIHDDDDFDDDDFDDDDHFDDDSDDRDEVDEVDEVDDRDDDSDDDDSDDDDSDDDSDDRDDD